MKQIYTFKDFLEEAAKRKKNNSPFKFFNSSVPELTQPISDTDRENKRPVDSPQVGSRAF